MEITETPPEEESREPKQEESRPATESVIREIDSILGTGPDETALSEDIEHEGFEKKSRLKVAALIMCLIAVVLASFWLVKSRIPYFKTTKDETAQSIPLKGPFFSIDENTLTYEMLSHEQEGNVLVIKGNLIKITAKPVESVMVEARVY
ncbi:MAG TPA: hypothetical protein VMU10_07115, partial [Desulfomonilia bacterium]|nr:hypothetical protein [Desulfomonilia bacterium]